MWLLSYSHKAISFIRVGNAPILFTVPDIVCANFLGRNKKKEGGKMEGKDIGKQARRRQKRRNGDPRRANWEDIWFSVSSRKAGRVKCRSYQRLQYLKAEIEHQNIEHWTLNTVQGIMLSSNHRSPNESSEQRGSEMSVRYRAKWYWEKHGRWRQIRTNLYIFKKL